MEYTNISDSQLDVINYLAIDSLEKLGNFSPTEAEIGLMEKTLVSSINSILQEQQESH